MVDVPIRRRQHLLLLHLRTTTRVAPATTRAGALHWEETTLLQPRLSHWEEHKHQHQGIHHPHKHQRDYREEES